MDLIATLLLAHLIADFPLQVDWLFRLKKRHWAGVLLHSAMHVAVTAMLLRGPLAQWPALIALGAVHYTIDTVKLRLTFRLQSLGFLLDQLAHVLSLLLVAAWCAGTRGALPQSILYPTVAYALLPTVLMLVAMLTIDLTHSVSSVVSGSPENTRRIILLSQWVGYFLVAAVIVFRFG
jgi:hypothetical protein